jgi:hypothetical protein
MTCFWDGLINSLDIKELKYINLNQKPKVIDFIKILKYNNKKTNNITWNDYLLNNIELDENFQSIENYDINSYN